VKPGRITCVATAALVVALGMAVAHGADAAPGNRGTTLRSHPRIVSKVVGLNRGGLTKPVGSPAGGSLLTRQGYLVPDEGAYLATKQRLAGRAGVPGPSGDPSVLATPSAGELLDWSGVNDHGVTPSDSTGAIGPRRFIEVVNDRVGIYRRDGTTLTSGGLASLGGGGSPLVTDPQMIWDPGTGRFYYALLDYTRSQTGSGSNVLLFGYSRKASPSDLTGTSWCKYGFAFTTAIPDYPKLGDDRHFLLFGANVFNNAGTGYLGSYTFWASKPGRGEGCADPSKLRSGEKLMRLPGGAPAWTPVPANQIDTSGTGYVLASDDVGGGGSSTRILEYSVTKNSKGKASFSSPDVVPVTSYAAPPSAPQSGVSQVLDTLDGRLTNAVSAVDPSSGKVMIWTQHAVAGTSGTSAVLWHEIDAAGAIEHSTGIVDDGSNFFFNGSISPDRLVDGSIRAYGSSAVLGYDRSSSAETPSIRMSSITPLGNSPEVTVIASSGSEVDFSCPVTGPLCRWGDYAGASPDPAASPYANNGVVWLTSMYSSGVSNLSAANWLTRNWVAVPDVTATMTPLDLFQRDTDFRVGWSDVSGSSTFDTRVNTAPYNANFGGYAAFMADGPGFSTKFSDATGGPAALGDTYCFEVQPHDGSDAGHGYSNETCTAVPLDDQDLAASSGWTTKNSSDYFAGTISLTRTKGARLSGPSDAHMKDIDVLVSKCPNCGRIGVYLNGTLLRTISLRSSTNKTRALVHVATFSSLQTGTVKIKVVSSSGSVRIDGLGISRV
jgi:hypothetical protein